VTIEDRHGLSIEARVQDVDPWPRTADGATDTAALAARVPGADAVPEEPQGETEMAVATVWREVLGLRRVGRHDRFFDVGGHSLAALQVVTRLQERFQVTSPLAALFEANTVATLAQLVDGLVNAKDTTPQGSLVWLRRGEAPPLVLVHPAGGGLLLYRDLVRSLPARRALLGIEARGLRAGETPATSVETMAHEYLEALTAAGVRPPIVLAGSSLGGLIAFEMATRLAGATGGGEPETVRLVLLDTPAPPEHATPVSLEDDHRFLTEMLRVAERVSGRDLQIAALE